MAEARSEPSDLSSEEEHASYEGYALLPSGPLDFGDEDEDDLDESEGGSEEEAERQANIAYSEQIMVMTERERLFLMEANRNAAAEAASEAAPAASADVAGEDEKSGAAGSRRPNGACQSKRKEFHKPAAQQREDVEEKEAEDEEREEEGAPSSIDTAALQAAMARAENVQMPAAILLARFVGEIPTERVAPARLEAEDFDLSTERIAEIQNAMAGISLPGLPAPPWLNSGEDDQAWLARLTRDLQSRRK
eukprot:m.7430 g.7430  ORF g.7430 m.7430 type:complete len:250 (+) comp5023_c0_seq1:47-796(+)